LVGQRHGHRTDLRDLRRHRLPIMSFTLVDGILGRNSTAPGDRKLGTHITASAVSRWFRHVSGILHHSFKLSCESTQDED
jgi:hypothetical protein